MSDAELLERIERLERSNRRLKVATIGLGVLFVGLLPVGYGSPRGGEKAIIGAARITPHGVREANILGLSVKEATGRRSTFNLVGHFYGEQTAPTPHSIQGVEGYVRATHRAGTVHLMLGTIGNVEVDAPGGSVDWAQGVRAGGLLLRGSVDNVAAFYAAGIGKRGDPEVGKAFGLYVAEQRAGSENYAIWTEANPSHFGGEVFAAGFSVAASGESRHGVRPLESALDLLRPVVVYRYRDAGEASRERIGILAREAAAAAPELASAAGDHQDLVSTVNALVRAVQELDQRTAALARRGR